MLEAALAAGVAGEGGDALVAGVLPTPGGLDPRPPARARPGRGDLGLAQPLARQRDQVLRRRRAQARRRVRGPDRGARSAARRPSTPRSAPRSAGSASSRAALDDYLRELERGLPARPLRAAGSCSTAPTAPPTAPRRRSSAGSAPTVEVIAAEPDGRNINEGCGSTHPEALAERVARGRRRDRLRASTATATGWSPSTPTGARPRRRRADRDRRPAPAPRPGALAGGVAVTVMSNYGFHQAMDEAGIEVATTAVGDRTSRRARRRASWTLGGEQSGHVIWTDFAPTGDGIAAALLTLAALGGRRAGRGAADRAAAAGARERRGRRPRRARATRRRSGRRSSARAPRSRAAAGCWSARRAPSRWCG